MQSSVFYLRKGVAKLERTAHHQPKIGSTHHERQNMPMNEYDLRFSRGPQTITAFIEPGLSDEVERVQKVIDERGSNNGETYYDDQYIFSDALRAYGSCQRATSVLDSRTFCGICSKVLLGNVGGERDCNSPLWLVLIVMR